MTFSVSLVDNLFESLFVKKYEEELTNMEVLIYRK